ncbi:hypothetical protein B0A48_02444 [Cryoendolithus antarcticus]|uniref:DUF7580 domain-containing protein n=1 Tax=Cryoendolithus antarcticus TaxID=1507870 RepID=A0A1V8TNM9_9PEZI|nr:hypothetical protein B0A48_02444 [Cryoendolithus antarcticus]
MEVAGVVLGAVPIMIEALKAWKTVGRTLRTLRSYSREVNRIHDRLRVQQCLFDSEIETLLQSTSLGADVVRAMLDDPSDHAWTTPFAKSNIASVLARNADIYRDLMQSILGELGSLQKKLGSFDQALAAQKKSNDTLRDNVTRLRSAMKLSFNKADYEKHIEAIRDDNADLRAIRSYSYQPSSRLVVSSELPPSFPKARKAIKALYEALDGTWSCSDAGHVRHAAKLCLEAEVGEDVRLDLAIACTSTASSPPEPLWLYVRSSTSVPASQLPPNAGGNAGPNASAVGSTSRDLKTCPSVCETLSQCRCPTNSEECLGYVEGSDRLSQQPLRHDFFHQCVSKRPSPSMMTERTATAVLETTPQISVEDQLRMAHSIAKAVLHLFETPWMADEWSLKDISMFLANGQQAGDALDTMHMTTLFRETRASLQAPPATQVGPASSSSSLQSPSCSDEQTLYGVPNLILFSLGVALLEIAHRAPLETFRRPNDKNNFYTARRLAQNPSALGQRYQSIAQKCLQCDFGIGNELRGQDLQGRVYGDVVGGLGRMVEVMSIA